MCMIDDASDERVTVLHERHYTAKKEHTCNECRRVINAGEHYMVERFIHEGEAHTHKTCRHCERVRQWLNDECGGFLYGDIEEDIREHADEGYGLAVKMMAIGMERNWKRRDGRMWPLPRMPKLSAPVKPVSS